MELKDLVGRYYMKKAKRPGGQPSVIFLVDRVVMDELVLRSPMNPTYEYVKPGELEERYTEIPEEVITKLIFGAIPRGVSRSKRESRIGWLISWMKQLIRSTTRWIYWRISDL